MIYGEGSVKLTVTTNHIHTIRGTLLIWMTILNFAVKLWGYTGFIWKFTHPTLTFKSYKYGPHLTKVAFLGQFTVSKIIFRTFFGSTRWVILGTECYFCFILLMNIQTGYSETPITYSATHYTICFVALNWVSLGFQPFY